MKIAATRLLLENQEYTFVTSVFNGSTSLRDAAGQLIESVTKAVRRKTEIDDAYIDDLYDDMNSLYHLDQTSALGGTKAHFGELPTASKALLITLLVIWVGIITYLVIILRKRGIMSFD